MYRAIHHISLALTPICLILAIWSKYHKEFALTGVVMFLIGWFCEAQFPKKKKKVEGPQR